LSPAAVPSSSDNDSQDVDKDDAIDDELLKKIIMIKCAYTGGGNVWCDIAKYIVKLTQEKWA
jgi:hypothetical protein